MCQLKATKKGPNYEYGNQERAKYNQQQNTGANPQNRKTQKDAAP